MLCYTMPMFIIDVKERNRKLSRGLLGKSKKTFFFFVYSTFLTQLNFTSRLFDSIH